MSLTIEVRGLDPREGLAAVLDLVGPEARLVADAEPFEVRDANALCKAVVARYAVNDCLRGGVPEALARYNAVDPRRLQVGQLIQIPQAEPYFYKAEYPMAEVNEAYKTNIQGPFSISEFDTPIPLRVRKTAAGDVLQGAFQGFRLQTEPIDASLARELYSELAAFPYRSNLSPRSGAPDLRVIIDAPASHRSSGSATQKMPLYSGIRRPSDDPPIAGEEASYLHLVDFVEPSYRPPACVQAHSGNPGLKLVFIDRPLASGGHPDLFPSNASEGACVSDSLPAGKELPEQDYDPNADHGMHMVGVVAACNNEQGLEGIAPGAPYELVPWEDDRDSDYIDREREARTFTSRFPIFVFASQLPNEFEKLGELSDSASSYGASFDTPEGRYQQPALKSLQFTSALVWLTAAGQKQDDSGLNPEITQTSHRAPMNIGDNPAVIVVTACDPCTERGAVIPPKAFRSGKIEPDVDADAIPLMVNVAAPGMDIWGLDLAQPGYSKAGSPSTSHATAYVAGVVRGMLNCYWDHYGDGKSHIKGHLKERLMLTSWPGHLDFKDRKGKWVTVGIVDPRAAWLDPTLSWLRTTDQKKKCFRPAGAVMLDHTCKDVQNRLDSPQLRADYGRFDIQGWCRDRIPFANGNPRFTGNMLRLAAWPNTSHYFSVSSIYPERRSDARFRQWLALRAGRLDTRGISRESPLLSIGGKAEDGEDRSKVLSVAEISDVILNDPKGTVACQ